MEATGRKSKSGSRPGPGPEPRRRPGPGPGPWSGAGPTEEHDHHRQARFVVRLHWGVIALAPLLTILSGRSVPIVSWLVVGLFVLVTAVLQAVVSLRPAGVSWRSLSYAFIALDLLVVTALVWARGGLATDAYHFYYPIVVAAAVLFGGWESLVLALAAGLLYGSAAWWVADDVDVLGRVAIRTVYFVLTGAVAGYAATEQRRHRLARDEARRLLSELQEAHTALKAYAREMSQRAVTDGLTGLYNHTYFHQRLDEEISRSDRYHRPFCLLMLDLDGFKSYNDTYGHPRGDRILAEVAALITAQVRKVDVVCRYGGEEFAVIMPETDTKAALAAAERIRLAVEGAFPGDGSDDARPRPVTVSVGVAGYPSHASSRAALVEAADRALYLSKRRGKNSVTLSDGAVAAAHPEAVAPRG